MLEVLYYIKFVIRLDEKTYILLYVTQGMVQLKLSVSSTSDPCSTSNLFNQSINQSIIYLVEILIQRLCLTLLCAVHNSNITISNGANLLLYIFILIATDLLPPPQFKS
jgi:hypothetical protein